MRSEECNSSPEGLFLREGFLEDLKSALALEKQTRSLSGGHIEGGVFCVGRPTTPSGHSGLTCIQGALWLESQVTAGGGFGMELEGGRVMPPTEMEVESVGSEEQGTVPNRGETLATWCPSRILDKEGSICDKWVSDRSRPIRLLLKWVNSGRRGSG